MVSCYCVCVILLALLGLLWCYASSQSARSEALLLDADRPIYGSDGPVLSAAAEVAAPPDDTAPAAPGPEEPFAPLEVGENPGAPLVDLLADGPPAVPASGAGQGLTIAEETTERNVDLGGLLQDTAALPRTGERPGSTLAELAQKAEELSVKAAVPAPPQFEPLSLDVLPQKYWQPTFPGCQPVFTDAQCDYFYPTPRLWAPDLQQLQYARSLEQGRVNLIEPLRARQALAQLLSIGVRTRKDVYTQASPSNDIASQNVCAKLASATPTHVWL